MGNVLLAVQVAQVALRIIAFSAFEEWFCNWTLLAESTFHFFKIKKLNQMLNVESPNDICYQSRIHRVILYVNNNQISRKCTSHTLNN